MPAFTALVLLAAAAPQGTGEPPRRSGVEVLVQVQAEVLRSGTSAPESGDMDLRRQKRPRPQGRSTVEFE